jgi:dihydrofolate reductase
MCLRRGANVAQQFLNAGLVDEIQIHLVPVLLKAGIRLFEHLGTKRVKLQRIRLIESPFATHLKFRIIK